MATAAARITTSILRLVAVMAPIADLLSALGTSAAALSGPLLQPIARTLGAQLNAEAAKFSSQVPGSNQPDWLVQVNRGIEQAAKSVDTKVIIPALLGAGVIAALFFSDDCGPSGSSN